jgi:hypothetical protein
MTRSQFENLLRRAGELARDRDFFLIGSQAIRGVASAVPRDFPKTIEADLYPRHHSQAWGMLRERLGKGSVFFKKHGYYLDCTDPGLATLPEGWTERLIPFRTPRTGGVTAWCLEPHDLFVSKLFAWREKDQLFMKCMLRHKLAKPAVVLRRIADLAIPASGKAELGELLEQLVAERRRLRLKRA